MKFYFHICNTHDIPNNKLWKATLCSISDMDLLDDVEYICKTVCMCALRKNWFSPKRIDDSGEKKEERKKWKIQNDTDIVLFWCEEMQKTSFTLMSLRKGKKCVRQESASVPEQHERCTAANDTQNMYTKCWNFQYFWCTEFEHKNQMSKQEKARESKRVKGKRERERRSRTARMKTLTFESTVK